VFVCSFVCNKDEDECAYWDLSPVVCNLIDVQYDGIIELLHKAGLNSLGLYCFSVL